MSSIEKKISRGIIFQFFSFGFAGLVQILFIPFIINKLGKSQYGIYEIAFSLTIFNALIEFGIGSTITNYIKKYYDEDKEKYRSFFWSFFWLKVFISIVVCFICLFMAINVGLFYQKVDSESLLILKQSIIWFALGVILTNLVSFFDNVQTGFVRYDLNSITNISSKIFFIIIFFIWYYSWDKLSIADFCFITFILVPLFRLFHQIIIIFMNQYEIITKPTSFDIKQVQSKLQFLGGFSLITFLAQFYKHGITFLLGLTLESSVVGEFGIIKKILDLINGVSDMLVRPIMPAARDLLKKYNLKNLVYSMSNLHAFIVIGLATLVIVNSSALSTFFLNNKYNNFDLHLSIMTLPRFLPSVIVMLMLYYADGKTKINVLYQFLRVTFALLCGFIGFKINGFLGLLIGLSAGTILAILFNLNNFLNYYKVISPSKFFRIYSKKWLAAILSILSQIVYQKAMGISLVSILLWNLTTAAIFIFILREDIMQLAKKYMNKL